MNFVEDISTNINIIDIAGRRSSCWFCRPACSTVRWNWRLESRQQEVDVVAAGLEEIPGAAAASSGTWGKERAALSRDTQCRDWVGAQPLPLYNSTGTSFCRGGPGMRGPGDARAGYARDGWWQRREVRAALAFARGLASAARWREEAAGQVCLRERIPGTPQPAGVTPLGLNRTAGVTASVCQRTAFSSILCLYYALIEHDD